MTLLEATVTPKYINEPRGNAKSASIKDADGTYWGIPPAMMSSFRVGQPYIVKYDVTDSKDGTRQFKNIKSATPVGGASVVAMPQKEVRTGHGGGFNSTDTATAERIFVCGILNAAVRSGACSIEAEELARVVRESRAAWAETFGKDGK